MKTDLEGNIGTLGFDIGFVLFLFFLPIRYRAGLVGPRALVAGQELLAVADALDAGPVRRPGRRAAPLHADAQDAARPATRPALHRL